MDRLTRITMLLAIVVFASKTGMAIGNNGTELLALLALIGAGALLVLLSVTRLLVLAEGWSTAKAALVIGGQVLLWLGCFINWMASEGTVQLFMACVLCCSVLLITVLLLRRMGTIRREWSLKLSLPLLIAAGSLSLTAFSSSVFILDVMRSPGLLNGTCVYDDAPERQNIVLRRNGTADYTYNSMLRFTERGKYSLHGDTVLLKLPKAKLVLLLKKDMLIELGRPQDGHNHEFALSVNKLKAKP